MGSPGPSRHGHTRGRKVSREYNSWQSMRKRCYDAKHRAYKWYGGRGIGVCARWRDSFDAFLADMGTRPPGTTLDRIDNDKNYEPGNARWATQKEQCRRRSSNRLITHAGVTCTLVEWAERCGVPYRNLHARLNYYGWSFAKAIIP